MSFRPVCAASGLLMAFALLGCNKGPAIKTVPVTGTVMYKGQAVSGALVNFMSQGDSKQKSASGETDAAGKFSLSTMNGSELQTGAMEGSYTVLVQMPTSAAGSVPGQPAPGTDPANVDIEAMGKGVLEGGGVPAGDPEAQQQQISQQAAAGNNLPAKYAEVETTTLKATVKAGEKNDFPFDLED